MLIMLATTISYMLHHTTCCGRKRKQRRTRFPISMAQWARLAITMDNLTYLLWLWTAIFWIFHLLHSLLPEDVRVRASGDDGALLDRVGLELVQGHLSHAPLQDGPEHGGQRGVLPELDQQMAHHAAVLHHSTTHAALHHYGPL